MDDTRAQLQGAPATASVSGLTYADREAGRLTDGNQDAAAIDVDIELEESPGDEPRLRNRVMTPERPPAVRRPVEYFRDVGKSRRCIDDDGDAAADHVGATTCSMASDEDVDHSMDVRSHGVP